MASQFFKEMKAATGQKIYDLVLLKLDAYMPAMQTAEPDWFIQGIFIGLGAMKKMNPDKK